MRFAIPRGQAYDVRILPSGPLGGYVHAPPSKNYTTRMVLAAALADGTSTLAHAASNDDALALMECCKKLGARITQEGDAIRIRGVAGCPANPGQLNPGNAGAVLRLLIGAACLVEGEVRFATDHPESLGRRPNRELLQALGQLGAEFEAQGADCVLPITIRAGRSRMKAGSITVDCSRSSQFLSSLLFLAPHLSGETEIRVTGEGAGPTRVLVSRPLINQTLEVLKAFGAAIERTGDFDFHVKGNTTLRGTDQTVNGDWPSAAALMAAIAVAGGMGSITGLKEDAQGERRAADALEAMGCSLSSDAPDQRYIHSHANLKAIDFDGDLATDAVLALEAAACLASGTSRFRNIGNLRIKETDRIARPLAELRKIGVESRYGENWVGITGRPEGFVGGIEVDCLGDHRVAQMLAIVGLRCEKGLILRGAECVSKSYPDFFADLHALGAKMEVLEKAAAAV